MHRNINSWTMCRLLQGKAKLCRLMKGHKGDQAAPCPSCFEQGISISVCRLNLRHCGPGVSWCTSTINEDKISEFPACCSHNITCMSVTSTSTTHPVDESACISYAGVVQVQNKIVTYQVLWQKQYMCHRGGKARYKTSNKENVKPYNAPGTRLTECTATINIRLMKLKTGEEILHLSFPLLAAHTEHLPSSFADLHTFKPYLRLFLG